MLRGTALNQRLLKPDRKEPQAWCPMVGQPKTLLSSVFALNEAYPVMDEQPAQKAVQQQILGLEVVALNARYCRYCLYCLCSLVLSPRISDGILPVKCRCQAHSQEGT